MSTLEPLITGAIGGFVAWGLMVIIAVAVMYIRRES